MDPSRKSTAEYSDSNPIYVPTYTYVEAIAMKAAHAILRRRVKQLRHKRQK